MAEATTESSDAGPSDAEAIATAGAALLDRLEEAIVGKRAELALVVTALLANGHLLLEDVPGVAKTATARALAQAAGLDFRRVQFTPDLIPADITGSTILSGLSSGTTTGELVFRPGPIFANLVLGDEINRAPPKTQSALLEAMEERQVTVDGETRRLPDPFLVVGTQNPIESEGTYPLPEAQLDRFLFRMSLGYPSPETEADMVRRRARRGVDHVVLDPVSSAEDIVRLQQAVERIHVSDSITNYIVALVGATRTTPMTEAGASPRGSLGLLRAGRAWAGLHGRNFVLPDDIKAVATPVLAHRILLDTDQWIRGVRPEEVIAEILNDVPAPAAVEPNVKTVDSNAG
jgi:MoxR-like ATPase